MALIDDEKLAHEVRKFSCLYDKSLNSYKESQPKKNAWKAIDEELGKECGESKQAWSLLLNRYSKRKCQLRKVNVSGADTQKVQKARKNLEEYGFLSWIDCFLRSRSSTSNVVSSDGFAPLNPEDPSQDSNFTCDSATALENDSSHESPPAPTSQQQQKRKERKRVKKEDDICGEIRTYLQERKLRNEKINNNPDEMFGKFIASELKQFPEDKKYVVKHEIHQVIFKHQAFYQSLATAKVSSAQQSGYRYDEGETSTAAETSGNTTSSDVPPLYFNNI